MTRLKTLYRRCAAAANVLLLGTVLPWATTEMAEEAQRQKKQVLKDFDKLMVAIARHLGTNEDFEAADVDDPAFLEQFDPWQCLRDAEERIRQLEETIQKQAERLRERQDAPTRVYAAEAQAAAMRQALGEARCLTKFVDWRGFSSPTDLTEATRAVHAVERALAPDAGRALLARLEAADRLASAASACTGTRNELAALEWRGEGDVPFSISDATTAEQRAFIQKRRRLATAVATADRHFDDSLATYYKVAGKERP